MGDSRDSLLTFSVHSNSLRRLQGKLSVLCYDINAKHRAFVGTSSLLLSKLRVKACIHTLHGCQAYCVKFLAACWTVVMRRAQTRSVNHLTDPWLLEPLRSLHFLVLDIGII